MKYRCYLAVDVEANTMGAAATFADRLRFDVNSTITYGQSSYDAVRLVEGSSRWLQIVRANEPQVTDPAQAAPVNYNDGCNGGR